MVVLLFRFLTQNCSAEAPLKGWYPERSPRRMANVTPPGTELSWMQVALEPPSA